MHLWTRWDSRANSSIVCIGAAMNVCYNKEQMRTFLNMAVNVSKEFPVVVSASCRMRKRLNLMPLQIKGSGGIRHI